MASRAPRDRWLALIVVLAVALRLGHVLSLVGTPWFDHLVVDPEYYDAWARQIAAGDWLGSRPFYMDPLYPYALAVVYRIAGRDLLLVRLLQVGVSAVSCVAVGRLGAQLAGPVAGRLAALGFALYLPEIFYVGEIDKTCLSVGLVAVALALGFGGSLRARFGAGFALGLAALTRANLLLMAPLTLVAVALDKRSVGRGAAVLAFAGGIACALAPVAWRNHHVDGGWVLTTSQAGQNFYIGNNPTNAYGAFGVLPFVRANPHFEEEDFRAAAEARVGRPLGPAEVSRFWFGEAFRHMRANPDFAVRALLRKAALFWNDFEIADNQDQYLLARDSPVLALPLLGFGAVAPLALLGAIAGWGAGRVRGLVGFVLAYAASVVAFFIFSRYRIQVVPALLPLAALGVVSLGGWLRARAWTRFGAGGAVVGLAAIGCFTPIGIFARDHPLVIEMRLRHLADVYRQASDVDRTVAVLQEAVAGCASGCPFALDDLANAYVDGGRAATGVEWFRAFAAAHPEQPDAAQHLERLRAAAER